MDVAIVMRVVVRRVEYEALAVAVAGMPKPLKDSLPRLAVSEAGIACADWALTSVASPAPQINPRDFSATRMVEIPRSMLRDTLD